LEMEQASAMIRPHVQSKREAGMGQDQEDPTKTDPTRTVSVTSGMAPPEGLATDERARISGALLDHRHPTEVGSYRILSVIGEGAWESCTWPSSSGHGGKSR
jgi:hypothetical protein